MSVLDGCTTEKYIYYNDLNTVGIQADNIADLQLCLSD